MTTETIGINQSAVICSSFPLLFDILQVELVFTKFIEKNNCRKRYWKAAYITDVIWKQIVKAITQSIHHNVQANVAQ